MPKIQPKVVHMDGRKALAKAFDDFLVSSGLTQVEVSAMGGPSSTTQTKIRLTDDPIPRQTLKKIDLVMGWGDGMAARVLAGDRPPLSETVGADLHTDGDLLYRRPEGVSDPEWERIKGEAQSWIEWQVQRADRER